ncbi:MAG TPA: hypothetical protein VIZ43_03155 [Trebonia sp.]
MRRNKPRRVVFRTEGVRTVWLSSTTVTLVARKGGTVSLSLGSLQACPPLAGLVERQLTGRGSPRLPDELHGRNGPVPAEGVGRYVVRDGAEPPAHR